MNENMKWWILVWVALWGICSPAEAQTPMLRERVTLKHDKPQGCEWGDTLHFEAFVEREGKEGATDYSRVLYVELLSRQGYVVVRKKMPIVDGWAKGTLWVDSLYGSGFYELRAYTRYMTNWNDCQYFSQVVPVWVPERLLKKPLKEGERCLRTYSSRMVSEKSPIAERVRHYRDTIFALTQPVEKNLMVFGHIELKYKNPTETDKRLGNRRLLMMVNQGEKRFGGSAETDSMGRYALFFPDMQGEWNLRIRGPKGVDWSRWRVMLDELFAPHPRYLLADELEPKNFGLKKWKNEKGDEKWTSCFIDCNEATLAMKNSSYIPTGFYAFLGRADNRFERTTGVASPIILNVARDSAYHKYIDLELIGHDSTDPRTVCVDGPSFNGRPIVWIVNGAYRLVTGLKKEITDFEVLRPTRKSMPLYADEVKRVFITENPTAFLPYVRCSVLEKKRPVTVFVELNAHFVYDDSGLMNTSWEGFSEE